MTTTRTWTREEAASLLAGRQWFGQAGDCENVVIDGDGEEVFSCFADNRRAVVEDAQDRAALIAFVLNDYAKAFGGGS